MKEYTLSQLKRDAKSGKIKAEMLIQCGNTEITERCRGIRPLVDSNSVGITFLNADGKRSEMQIKRAKLVSYTDEYLTIYYPSQRPLNDKEQSIMNEWNKIKSTDEYKEREMNDAYSDGSSTYYQEKAFFERSECPYLFGFEESKGCKYNRFGDNIGTVTDYSIRSDKIECQYKLYKQN